MIVTIIPELFAGTSVRYADIGAGQEPIFYVRMGSKAIQRKILHYVATPPSGVRYPAIDTLLHGDMFHMV